MIDLNAALQSPENWLFVVSIPRRRSGILNRQDPLRLIHCHVEAHELGRLC
jgi:predicted sugar kinase